VVADELDDEPGDEQAAASASATTGKLGNLKRRDTEHG